MSIVPVGAAWWHLAFRGGGALGRHVYKRDAAAGSFEASLSGGHLASYAVGATIFQHRFILLSGLEEDRMRAIVHKVPLRRRGGFGGGLRGKLF